MQYRLVDLVALRNRVFTESRYTANDRRIKRVLEALADETLLCENLDNPERSFISERIVKGGKAVLRVIYGEYRSWCETRRIRPATQAALRKEIEDLYPGTYRKNVRAAKRQDRGFYGLSLCSDIAERESIFTDDNYTNGFS